MEGWLIGLRAVGVPACKLAWGGTEVAVRDCCGVEVGWLTVIVGLLHHVAYAAT